MQSQFSSQQLKQFCAVVQDYYRLHGRHNLPWRQVAHDGTLDPYAVLVSELMLQQTQVARVIPKYLQFLERFPTIQDLARAPLVEVLSIWSGLGYNRRAKFLQAAAQMVTTAYGGTVPDEQAKLVLLPGVGQNTAGAIMAYAYNQPVPFIETNIRTVFIDAFFPARQRVSDAEIVPLVAATLDHANPREWYWALMDYGSHLKAIKPNPSRASTHHTVQSRFEGSRRQLRGQVLRELLDGPKKRTQLEELYTDSRLMEVVDALQKEGFIEQQAGLYRLAK